MTTPDTPKTAPVAATRADRERLAAYYRHPLVANPSRAEAVLADDWLSGASYGEIAMLETLARHRTANETAPPARSVRTRPKEVSMTVSKPETVEVTQALEPCPFCGSDKVSFDIMSRDADGEPSDYSPECPSCGATIISGPGENLSKERATSLWNRRHRLNATPSREALVDDPFWVPHNGKGNPVAAHHIVEIKHRGGTTHICAAGSVQWQHGQFIREICDFAPEADIVAYRMVNVLKLNAALSAAPTPSRQDGWVSVPRVPTREMYEAAFESSPWDEICPIRRVVDEVWNAMLRAALSDTPPPDKAAGQ